MKTEHDLTPQEPYLMVRRTLSDGYYGSSENLSYAVETQNVYCAVVTFTASDYMETNGD